MNLTNFIIHYIPLQTVESNDHGVFPVEKIFCLDHEKLSQEKILSCLSVTLWSYNTTSSQLEILKKCFDFKLFGEEKNRYLKVKFFLKAFEIRNISTHAFYFTLSLKGAKDYYDLYSSFYTINEENLKLKFTALEHPNEAYLDPFIKNLFSYGNKEKMKLLAKKFQKFKVPLDLKNLKFPKSEHNNFFSALTSKLNKLSETEFSDFDYLNFKRSISENYKTYNYDQLLILILEIRRILYSTDFSTAVFLKTENITSDLSYYINIHCESCNLSKLDCFLFLKYDTIVKDMILSLYCEEGEDLYCFVKKEDIDLKKLTSLRITSLLDGKVIIDKYLDESSFCKPKEINIRKKRNKRL